jgi:hypothetical protein
MWKVQQAREAAWTSGEVLWHLRTTPLLRRDFLARLDSITGSQAADCSSRLSASPCD